jgi:tetratricopeptide (TPR) repeat protein
MMRLVLIALVALQGNPPASLQRTYPYRGSGAVGEVVLLGIEGQVLRQTRTFALVAITPGTLAEQVKLSIAGDQEGLETLRDDKRLLEIPTGTRAKIVAKDFAPYQNAKVPFYQVKILEGTHKDKTVSVIPSFLISTREELTTEAKEQRKSQAEASAAVTKADKAEQERQTAERYAAIKLNVAKKYQKEGEKDLAIRYLQELLRLYPNSSSATEGRELLKMLGK